MIAFSLRRYLFLLRIMKLLPWEMHKDLWESLLADYRLNTQLREENATKWTRETAGTK